MTWGELCQELLLALSAYYDRKLRTRGVERRDDLVQDALMRLLKSAIRWRILPDHEDGHDLAAYELPAEDEGRLRGLLWHKRRGPAVHVLIDHLRRGQREAGTTGLFAIDDEEGRSLRKEVTSRETSPSDYAELAELGILVRALESGCLPTERMRRAHTRCRNDLNLGKVGADAYILWRFSGLASEPLAYQLKVLPRFFRGPRAIKAVREIWLPRFHADPGDWVRAIEHGGPLPEHRDGP